MKRHTYVAVLAVAAALLAAPSAWASAPIRIDFEKNCPELECEETTASPVDVSTVVTPLAFAGGIFHYRATETLSSASGSVTLDLVGILNLNADPDVTVLHGTVASGSWNGVPLSGARLHAEAFRVTGTTFRGTVMILPATAR